MVHWFTPHWEASMSLKDFDGGTFNGKPEDDFYETLEPKGCVVYRNAKSKKFKFSDFLDYFGKSKFCQTLGKFRNLCRSQMTGNDFFSGCCFEKRKTRFIW